MLIVPARPLPISRDYLLTFCAAHDAYVLTLIDGDSIESSVTYCDEVFDRYRSTMRQLRIMTSVELAPEPQRLWNDSAMTSSFVQALDLPPMSDEG